MKSNWMLSKFNSLDWKEKLIAINQMVCGVLVLSALPNVTKLIPWIRWDGAVLFFWLFFPIIVFIFSKEILNLIKNAETWVNILLLCLSILLTITLILIAL